MLVGSWHRHLASGTFENITLSNEQFCSDSPLAEHLLFLVPPAKTETSRRRFKTPDLTVRRDTNALLSAFGPTNFIDAFRQSQRYCCHVIAAITKYQASLASGTGLPIDDTPRNQLMAANLKVVEKIRTEIRALEHELDRQEGAEKSRS
jgi:hypothetical protein